MNQLMLCSSWNSKRLLVHFQSAVFRQFFANARAVHEKDAFVFSYGLLCDNLRID